MKRSLFFKVCLIVGVVGWVLVQIKRSHVVYYTESGFSPEQISINVGDRVRFLNRSKLDFWPASDFHPSHAIYSGFDPKQPINPGKSWTFTFSKSGTWQYHDHLSPRKTGSIRVLGKVSSGCSDPDNKLACWGQQVDAKLEKEGVDSAFTLISKLYESEPEFSAVCHDFVHKLGDSAYDLFSQDKIAVLSPKSSFCGYGFYHGFMEALLTTGGTLVQAREFCHQAQKQLAEYTTDAGGACFHGIGHGVADPHNEDRFSNIQELIDPGLRVCEEVAGNESELWRCATGVYNVAEIAASSNKYSFSVDMRDPFSICHVQKDKYKSACYPNLVPAAINLAQGNLSRSVSFLRTVPNEFKKSALISIMVEAAHQDGPQAGLIEYHLADCRSLDIDLRQTCINALAEGLLKYGPPQKEYDQAINFCKMNSLSASEKSECFGHVLSLLPIWYGREKLQEICSTVDTNYRQYCHL